MLRLVNSYLLAVLLVLAVITVLGHGIWVFLAWLIRSLSGGSPAPREKEYLRHCVFCGKPAPISLMRCQWCGRDLQSWPASELADLEALERGLRRFVGREVLPEEEIARLLAEVRAHRSRLMELAAAPPPATPGVVYEAAAKPGGPERPVQAEAEPAAASLVQQPSPAKPPVPPPPTAPPLTAAQPAQIEIVPAAAAELEASVQAPPTLPPPEPRRSFAEMLTEFMEPRNIRWGEVIGGLLFVGGAAALLISQWDKLLQLPYFRHFISPLILSAIFGLGLYSHYRWKLEATSRGLLIIATLLVPWNFLATAGLLKNDSILTACAVAGVSVAVFALLVSLAGRVLVPGGRWWQVASVVGTSALILPLPWSFSPQTPDWLFTAAGCLPVALLAAGAGGYCYRLSQHRMLSPVRATGLFNLLGTGAFALAVALGMLVVRGLQLGNAVAALDRLSVPVALAGVPILISGLIVVQRMRPSVALEPYRTAGRWIALVGMIVMLAALGLAWPWPWLIVAVGTFNCAALVFAAFAYRLPILHAGAIACAALAYLSGFYLLHSDLASAPAEALGMKMLHLAVSAVSGTALVGLSIALGVLAEFLSRWNRRQEAAIYAGGCAVLAVVSLLLVTVHGILGSDTGALHATVVYGICGAGSLAMNARFRRPLLSYLGSGLLSAAVVWGLWYQTQQIGPSWAAVLAAVALAMGLAATVLRRFSAATPETTPETARHAQNRNALVEAYCIPLLHVAEIVADAALALGLWLVWFDRALTTGSPSPMLIASAACLAVLYLLLAWAHCSAERTWLGSTAALAGLIYGLGFCYAKAVPQPWLTALLSHSTLAGLVGVLLSTATKHHKSQPLREAMRAVLVRPLGQTAVCSSIAALPVALLSPWESTIAVAGCLFWLAAIWLVLAWSNRWPHLFAAHQAVLTLAVLVAITAWLQNRQWVVVLPDDLLSPHAFQAYGIGLALLTLAWVVARIVRSNNAVAHELLNPGWPAVDELVKHAVVTAQILMVAWHLVPGWWDEVSLRGGPAATAAASAAAIPLPPAFGTGAWLLLGVLAVVLVASLWQRWGQGELVDAILLATTVPCLVAGQFAGQLAVGSALRWGLSACFIVCSVVVWQREPLARWMNSARTRIRVGPSGPWIAGPLLVETTALPVVALTILVAMLRFLGVHRAGPAAESFFAQMGPSVSYLVPLLAVLLGLVGYALRERSAGYAFTAGLVAELTVALGYTLSLALGGQRINVPELVTLIQLLTITAALWAIAWLVVRLRLDVWREGPKVDSARRLMQTQIGLGTAGNVLLLAAGLVTLIFFEPNFQAWTVAAGKPLGWLALALAAGAGTYRLVQLERRLAPNAAGLLGMAVLGLLACTIQGYWPDWGYRALMLGWATYALLVVLVTWWVASVRTLPGAQGPPQVLIGAAAVWVRAAGIAAVLLGLQAAIRDHDHLWAATAIALASGAGAAMAVWRRREGWAFSAALGVNLAASLVVWHFHSPLRLNDWWIPLVQANVIASAAVALVWLAARKRLYRLRELSIRSSPLLAVQTLLPIAGNVFLAAVFASWLIWTPGDYPDRARQLADVPGWLALLLTAAAAAWYLVQVSPQALFHVVGGLAVGLIVLSTCLAVKWLQYDNYLDMHTLMAGSAAAGLLLLAIGWLGRNFRIAAQDDGLRGDSIAAGQSFFPGLLVQCWVAAIGILAVSVALLCADTDPARPWWSAWAILCVSVTTGLLALWRSLPSYVYISGLLLIAAGTVIWMAWGPSGAGGLVYVNVLCLAIGSCVWSLVELLPGVGVPAVIVADRRQPFGHVAAQAAAGIMALTVLWNLVSDLFPSALAELSQVFRPDNSVCWIATAGTAAALAICVWDQSARFTLQGLYLIGLSTVGMGLAARELAPRTLCWTAAVEMAGSVLVAAVLGRLLPWLKPLVRGLRIPDQPQRWPADWFPPAQAVLCGAVAALSTWIACDFAFDQTAHPAIGWLSGRTAAPVATALLLPTAVLLAGCACGKWRAGWQYSAIGLGTLLLSEVGWAWLNPDIAAPWMHRGVILMVVAVVTSLAAGFGLLRVVPGTSDWIDRGRRVVPWFGGLAVLALSAVLLQEGYYYDAVDGAPMTTLAIVAMAAALSALILACLAFAVIPGLDPLRLSDRGRTMYVYAAELLLVLVGVHLRLTVPQLFQAEILRRYGLLLAMGVAFAGALLSELFQRRRVLVLAEPLERTALVLPVVPMIAFWFVESQTPAVWFLMGLVYGFLAVTRRSVGLGVLSVLTANTGLWILWQSLELGIQYHPQLWLIPLALAALAAEHFSRGRLTRDQSTAVRYIALGVIYLSSSADMFIAGIGNAPWLPLVLLVWSILGILAGMALRVRSFLYLGSTFLLVVIVAMMRYVAVEMYQEWTWIRWLCVIALGAAIITFFAFFEKRRNDILAAVQRFKQWER